MTSTGTVAPISSVHSMHAVQSMLAVHQCWQDGQLTRTLLCLTADFRGTPAVLVLALLAAPSALSCLGALGLSPAQLQKGSSEPIGCEPGPEGLRRASIVTHTTHTFATRAKQNGLPILFSSSR